MTLDFAEEPDGGGQLERDADALRGQADREEQAGRSKIIDIIQHLNSHNNLKLVIKGVHILKTL